MRNKSQRVHLKSNSEENGDISSFNGAENVKTEMFSDSIQEPKSFERSNSTVPKKRKLENGISSNRLTGNSNEAVHIESSSPTSPHGESDIHDPESPDESQYGNENGFDDAVESSYEDTENYYHKDELEEEEEKLLSRN